MSRWITLLAALTLIPTLVTLAQEPEIKVTKQPPKITRRDFDPKRPPKEMPKLTPPESGVCHFEFSTDTGIATDAEELSPGNVRLTVESVDIITSLTVEIWAMNGAPKKLRDHEEGHRQICEYYYKNIDTIAKELAKASIGKKYTGTGRDKKAAVDDANHKALSELNNAIMDKTRVRCSAAQKRYDAITNHGLKPITEADAIAQAIAEDPEPATEKPVQP